MCGIAGIVNSRSDVKESINRMLDVMHHRGPDDKGTHISNATVLGQNRLSIIDLEGGHQPIPNEDKTLWIVCNGEIYNYKTLRQELIAKGHTFLTHSDSEVVLHLFEEMGEKCVDKLNGMFAFAIWDDKNKRLFAARDRLGQKPFYYVLRGNEFAFASEIKALLAFDPSLRVMNLEALDQYLTLRIIAPPRSMFKEIKKLPPAHTLSFGQNNQLSISRYWNLNYEPKHAGSDEELADELEEKLITSIRNHMVSDVPVGAFLSGGLDSTLILGILMKHIATEPIQTFSMGLPYGQFDEAPYARMVAEKYGTQHHEQVITPSLVNSLPKLIWHLDEPSDPLSVCSYHIAEMASKHVKVVLGGDGGDELFGGYDRYYGNKYASYYAMLPSSLRKYGIGPLLNMMSDGRWYKSKAHQIKWLHTLSFLKGGERYARSLSYFYFGGKNKDGLYGDTMLQAIPTFNAESAICEAYDNAQAEDIVDRMLYADSSVRLPDHPVMILDRMTMAHSLEARAPFMDHEIAEFSARLPMRLKVKGKSLRVIQKMLAKRYIPEEVLNRPKQGFSSALPYMLKDEYKSLYNKLLVDSQLAKEGILNQNRINLLLTEHNSGKVDHGNRLWLLVNSEAWYRMFIVGMGKDELTSLLKDAA